MTRPASIVYIALAASAFVYGGMHAYDLARTGSVPALDVAGILDGKVQAGLEKAYDGTIPYKALAGDLLGSYRLAVFDEGHAGVVVGDAGWLFTSEEFKVADPKHLETALGYVRQVADELKASDIRLVVALVPQKALVEEARLGRYRLPPEAGSRYARVRDQLISDGIVAPDLGIALRSGGEGMYMRTDTHWSPEGAQIAADTVAKAVGPSHRQDWKLVEKSQKSIEGDLEGFRKAPYAPHDMRPGSGTVRILDAENTASADEGDTTDIFAATEIPVVLVGTSYSASPDWSFEPRLKVALGEDVLNLAEVGKGPFEPMRKFMKDLPGMEVRPETVVWEIPVRYLALPETDVPTASAPHDLVAGSSKEGPSL